MGEKKKKKNTYYSLLMISQTVDSKMETNFPEKNLSLGKKEKASVRRVNQVP